MKTIDFKFTFILFLILSLNNNVWSQETPGKDLVNEDLTTKGNDMQQGKKAFVRWINNSSEYVKEAVYYSIYNGSNKFAKHDKFELFRVMGDGTTCLFQADGYTGAALEFYTTDKKWRASLDNVNSDLYMRSLGKLLFVINKDHTAALFENGRTTFVDDVDVLKNIYIGMNASGVIGLSQEIKKKYHCFVNGGILSTDYAIAPRSTWSDFVFNKEYQLRSLDEVENYIDDNKHLPDVPSSRQVAENGYSQHDINKVLLQKIEELTLYTIQQQKEIEALKVELKESRK